jgi:hypothetical protein
VIECSDGGYAAVGYTYSFGVGGSDVLMLRLHANGTLLWNTTFGGALDEKAYSVVECSDGGFAVVGCTTSFGSGGSDAWLLRTDAAGNHIWNRTYGGPNYDEGWSLIQRGDGGFAIAGTYSHGPGGWDMWLILTDADGEYVADHTYGGPLDELCYSMVECSSGGFALGGHTESYGDGEYDYFLVRTDNDGTLLWNRTYGSPWFDELGALIECSSGGFALVGESTPSPGADSLSWLVRTDEYGNQLWNMTYDLGLDYDPRSYAIIESDDNDLVFTSCHGDIVVVRVDDDGNQIWARSYDKDLIDIGWSIVESTEHGFVIAGYAAHFVGGPKAHAYDVLVMHVPDPPRWTTEPVDHTAEYAESFTCQLDAVVPHGVDQWWLDTEDYFYVDADGAIHNATLTPVGNYTIGVSVNDTLGETLEGSFGVHVIDTRRPIWLEEPMDKIVKAGEVFRYNLNATDPSGIAEWDIDDKENFAIDSDGVITSNHPLDGGIYSLEVEVEDPHGNRLLGSFTVTAETGMESSWDFILALVMIAAVASIVVIIMVHRRRVGLRT